MTSSTKWVLIDKTNGAATKDGSKLTQAALSHIAEAVTNQLNNEFTAEWGGHYSIRVGANANDIQSGEWVYAFVGQLPDAPGASAYHDVAGGIPDAFCAVTTCGSLYGPDGVGVDVSHEIIETAGDPGANGFAFDGNLLHAIELCDAVEMQTSPKKCADGTVVQVSNWLMRTFFIPNAKGPYDYMTSAKLPGAVAPAGPFKTAQGNGGNYQIEARIGAERTVTAKLEDHIHGKRRKGDHPHPYSRAGKRLRELQKMGLA